jgi:hypothetical protein
MQKRRQTRRPTLLYCSIKNLTHLVCQAGWFISRVTIKGLLLVAARGSFITFSIKAKSEEDQVPSIKLIPNSRICTQAIHQPKIFSAVPQIGESSG